MKENLETKDFELKLSKAKELLDKLSDPEITLSDSISIYKDGIKELELAQQLLDEAKLNFSVDNKS